MKRQVFFKQIFLLSLGLLTACSTPNRHFKDTSALEKPPEFVIATGESESATQEPQSERRKGLNELVVSMDDTHLLLKQPLSQAWKTLENAIKESGLKLVDRNLEKGFYYVHYDPETFKGKNNSSWMSRVDDFLSPFKTEAVDDAPIYVISMRPKTDAIIIHTLLIDKANSADANAKPVTDASAKLLTVLYNTLHDGVQP